MPRLLAGALLGAVLMAGGCSADVARFDSPFFGFSDQSGATGSVPTPSEPVRRNVGGPPLGGTSEAGAYFPPPSGRAPPATGTVRMSALPEPAPPVAPQRVAAATPPRGAPLAAGPVATPIAPPVASPAAGGETIEVQLGDTLYALSRRHGVSVAELMSVNGLSGPALKPGQRLTLPAKSAAGRAKKPFVRPTTTASAPAAASAPAPKAAAQSPTSPAPSGWEGSYTVKPGDSPYAIARAHKVSLDELTRANGISDPRKVMPGTVLKVPGSAAYAPAAETAQPVRVAAVTPSSASPRQASDVPRVIQTTTQPVLINGAGGEHKTARLSDSAASGDVSGADAPAAKGVEVAGAGASAVPAGKFRWPVKGRILAGFGPRPDGSHNDGIRVAVPLGTEVHAAESGVVSYAGSELKGYGNLILVRHDNGWATAYAHNDELLVKRGDRIKRGQVIAKAGKSGTVDQPQVHFELRQGSRPIDPAPHMERM
jgi:murein DD-endopeptidase MepM/ murein hydrolase activator NlpD